MKLLTIAGARPNFMKIAPLMWELERRPGVDAFLVHTGQHYDQRMSELFFDELHIPRPDANLEVGSGSHAVQTAEIMKRIEPIVLDQHPDAMVVVGDVNSTIACALTAVKLGVPVAHIEAGLRSFDRTMPEEINRVLTDAISRWLFVSEPSGLENLRREGAAAERIFFVGNLMIDTLLACRQRSERSTILEQLELAGRPYGVLTLHRPSNVDDPQVFQALAAAVERLQRELLIVFPVHPRTRKSLAAWEPSRMPNLRLTDPLGYLDFMKLLSNSRLVLTDSGGIQEETTVLGVPCLTLRANTERPATVEQGTNQLVGMSPERIIEAGLNVLSRPNPVGRNADGLNWRYETFLKRCESRLGALLGANGAIYAVRRTAYESIPPGTIIDDFVIPLLIVLRKRLRLVYEDSAIAREETPPEIADEFRRRVRIGAGGFQSIRLLWPLVRPRYGWLAFSFVSHKLLRWLSPFFLLGELTANVCLSGRAIYLAMLVSQLVFVALTLGGARQSGKDPAVKLARLSAMFSAMNLALLIGFFRWLLGRQGGAWTPTARTS